MFCWACRAMQWTASPSLAQEFYFGYRTTSRGSRHSLCSAGNSSFWFEVIWDQMKYAGVWRSTSIHTAWLFLYQARCSSYLACLFLHQRRPFEVLSWLFLYQARCFLCLVWFFLHQTWCFLYLAWCFKVPTPTSEVPSWSCMRLWGEILYRSDRFERSGRPRRTGWTGDGKAAGERGR